MRPATFLFLYVRRDDLSFFTAVLSGTARSIVRGLSMAWFYLIIAGLLEVAWAYSMKRSEGFTLLAPAVITVVFMIASFVLLSMSMKSLPLGTAYTVWTGIGAVGAFLVGIAVLGEAATLMRMIAATFIVIGMTLMKLASSS